MLLIKQKRLQSLKKYMPLIQGKKIIVSVDIVRRESEAKKIGFSPKLKNGENVLPAALGPVTLFNAEGKEIVRKDLPMETHYRQAEWEWKQWCGRGQTITRSKIVDIPYRKYPRDRVEPPSIELTISHNKIISPIFSLPEDEEKIKHTINLFLEVFGECKLLNNKLEDLIKTPKINVNWLILPEGPIPWEKVEDNINSHFKKASVKEKIVYQDRLKTIEAYKPDFRSMGTAGFSGYIIFGFKKKNLYLCESIWHGNAIYVFEENWEELSKMTKAQIIRSNLHKERIIHYKNWKNKIHDLLK